MDSRVHQVVASPVHQPVPLSQRLVFRFGWSRALEKVIKTLGHWDDVPPLPLSWTRTAGPFFGNALAELALDGRSDRSTLHRADAVPEQQDTMITVTSFELHPCRRLPERQLLNPFGPVA